jgi:putative restriction endonuclease
MIKAKFTQYIKATNASGSQKATSYVRAIDVLNLLITYEPFSFDDCKNVWHVESIERIHELYLFVLHQSKKQDNNLWHIEDIPKSYLSNGFCSAALNCLIKFLVEFKFEQRLLNNLNIDNHAVTEVDLDYPSYLLNGLEKYEGKEVVREVTTRTNQNVFRTIILKIYNSTCCITGLNIPEVNIASHIVPWVEDKTIRLDPANGLCLSATYDAAFDKHLISIDEDYRLIIGKNITDFYTSSSVNEYFKKKQGMKIALPNHYQPKQSYLEIHRNHCDF